MKPFSLQRRLLVASLVWLGLLLPAGGGALSYAFRRSAEAAFDVRLEAWLDALVATLRVGPQGGVESERVLGDPRFEQPLSGWYWQVSGEAGPLAASRSLWDATLEQPPPAAAGAARSAPLVGPRGEPLRTASRAITLPGRDAPLAVLVAADAAELRLQIGRFDALLLGALGALGLAMLAWVATQMRLSLRPLRALARELGELRRGARERLGRGAPRELAPLVDSLNALLAHDAELVQRARDQAADLAHALKTPLSLVRAEAEELGGERGERIARHADAMRRHIERRLARAVPRPAVAGGRTPLRPVVEAIAETLARLHPACAIELDVPADLAFRGAREDLEEIAGNVLENACKWARGRARVAALGEDGWLLLEVEDDGPGLDPLQRDAVLERGARLDERAPGFGLGLAIVREVVDLNGGELRLDRGGLGGLRATLRLPSAAP
jgi:signal transduction histidine kinase